MAELKYEDYSFDIDPSMNQQVEQMNNFVIEEVKRPTIKVVGDSASNKLARISLVEKMIAVSILLFVVFVALVMIYVRTSINQMEHDISIVENEITVNEKEITRLQQEKNELSKADRIKQIAEKLGLSINDDNLRKVK
ncbi:cell division protein FtsL [Enterococcus cecorum]|uniref:cell division protein FtsL n=1 Tax=Enterococcus cecorum TaxID=44008 RepID=UPI00200B0C4D|nr:cell division protein FtsL [Enterococcus cecorum]